MKKLSLLLLLAIFMQPCHATQNSAYFWKTVACISLGLFVIDKSIPWLKYSWNYWHKIPKKEYIEKGVWENEKKVYQQKFSEQGEKISFLETRLTKFNDCMVDYWEASKTLDNLNKQIEILGNALNSSKIIADVQPFETASSDSEEETIFPENPEGPFKNSEKPYMYAVE